MNTASLEGLTQNLINYLLDGMSDYVDAGDIQLRKISALTMEIQERREGVYMLCIGMGMSEACFALTGEKKSGAIGGMIERLVTHWIARPLTQEAIRNCMKE